MPPVVVCCNCQSLCAQQDHVCSLPSEWLELQANGRKSNAGAVATKKGGKKKTAQVSGDEAKGKGDASEDEGEKRKSPAKASAKKARYVTLLHIIASVDTGSTLLILSELHIPSCVET